MGLKKMTLGGLLISSVATSVLAGPSTDVVGLVAQAMGGAQHINNATNQRVTAKIAGFAPLQAPMPGGEPEKFDRLQYTLTRALDGHRYQSQWQVDLDFPLQASYNFAEIINADTGAVIGVDSILQLPQAPMQAIRLAARKVNFLVTSPVELLKAMLATPQDVVYHGSHDSRRAPVTVLGLKRYGKEILLWVDKASYLPLKATYWDSNPAKGDTLIETRYSDWQEADGIKVPMRVTQKDETDLLIQIERQSVSFNNVFAQDPFEVPPQLRVPLDHAAFEIGLKYAQLFHRYVLVGIPFDLNQFSAESVFLQPVADRVFYLRGFTHHSLIIEMADYLILFDPVLLEERTQVALSLIKQHWPNKKIKYVVPTHFHVDHSAGARGYVADGAKLVTIEPNKRFFKNMLKAKHVIYPDLLSLLHKDFRLLEIEDEPFVFDDGERRVQLLQIDNRHAPGLLVPYIEDQKMIFVSDLYNPGAFPVPLPPQFSYWGLDLYKDLQPRGLDIQTIVGAHGDVGSYADFVRAISVTFGINQ
ncbi:MAG: MBL fold metallo-hydrolase [Gammaproteobacteria bacterium]|nr:MBL fold metallo-hydrolase [Gammaproteobacteria bacterium]MDH5799622.1 MBL fold metallo-hydrolase [Gammaproteobacteria bacterium]